jgi:hypothetical protein
MSRTKTWNVICLVLVTGVVAFLFIRHRALTSLRNQNASLRDRAEQLQNLRAENDRLKAQTQSAPVAGLSPDELRELLRLRGEIGTLRNQLAEATARTNLMDIEAAHQGDRASNTWSQVGADTPEAALQTLLWALNTTNFNRATGAFHFEVSGVALRPGARGVQDNFDDYVGNEMMRDWITNLQSLEIISAVPMENEDVMLKLWETTRDGNRHKVVADVRRVGSEWKFLAGMTVLEVDRAGDVSRFRWRRPFGREQFQRESPTPSP